MKGTFSDGSTYSVEIKHKLSSADQRKVGMLLEYRQKFIEAITALKTLGELSEGARQPDMIRWFEKEVRDIKGDITCLGQSPVKTEISFTYRDQTLLSHSSISKEDALLSNHSRKIGRKTAIINLLKDLRKSDLLTQAQRRELGVKLFK